LQNPVTSVGLAFHRQPRTAVERRPYQALKLPQAVERRPYQALKLFQWKNGNRKN